MGADSQDVPRHAGQVVRRVLLRRNIAVDAETAQLVAAAVQAALQAGAPSRRPTPAPARSRRRQRAPVLTWHRPPSSFRAGDTFAKERPGLPCGSPWLQELRAYQNSRRQQQESRPAHGLTPQESTYPGQRRLGYGYCSRRRRRPVWRCPGWRRALLLPPLVAPQPTLPSRLPGDAAGSCHLTVGGPKVQRRVHGHVDPPLQELEHPGIGTQHPQTAGTPSVNACLTIPGICGHDSPGRLPAAAGFRPGNLTELDFKGIRKWHMTILVVRFRQLALSDFYSGNSIITVLSC